MGDEEAVGTPPEEKTEEEVAEDYKALYEAELKAGAGRDKKISNLITEINKYREIDEKRAKERERLERQNMNNDQLQAYIDRKIDEIEANAQREIEKREAEFKEYKKKNRLLDAVSQVENFPPELMKVITIDWPEDDDRVKDIIQDLADRYNARLESHKFVIDNRRKINTTPRLSEKAGGHLLPSDKTWDKLTEDDQNVFVENASLDELKQKIKEDMSK